MIVMISIIWTSYNTIPYYLVVISEFGGKGILFKFQWLCLVLIRVALLLIAIITMWVNLPATYDYKVLTNNGLFFFDAMRSGDISSK